MAGNERNVYQNVYVTWFILGSFLCCTNEAYLTYKGHFKPNEDIYLEYGTGPLEFDCILNKSVVRPPYQNFTIYAHNTTISEKYLYKVNDHTIRYSDPNPPKQNEMFTCSVDNEGVDIVSVKVGSKPSNTTDFDCISYNLVNFTCQWTSRNDGLETTYELLHHFGKDHKVGNCPLYKTRNVNTTTIHTCFFNISTNPPYRVARNRYNFFLKARNKLGEVENEFEVSQYHRVKTSPPERLAVTGKGVSSMVLTWNIPTDIEPFGFIYRHKIMYWCEYCEQKEFRQVALLVSKNTTVTYKLTDLPYAYTLYDIRVSTKLNNTPEEPMWWSNNASIYEYTESTIPTRPPAAHPSSFMFVGEREVTIFWQQLEKKYWNGEKFKYDVTVYRNGQRINYIRRKSNTISYAQYENLLNNESYKFVIHSSNVNGSSSNASYVTVPAINNKNIREMYAPVHTSYGNDLYQVSWEPPAVGKELVKNYTVFWCGAPTHPASHMCDGKLFWETVPSNWTKFNVTAKYNSVTVAVSANGDHESTGMIWADCVVKSDQALKQLEEVRIDNISDTTITLAWSFKCVHKTGDIKGYFIEYCLTNYNSCVEPQKTFTINGSHHSKVTIPGLESYKTYTMWVGIVRTDGSYSQRSNQVWNTTLEGTPTEPYGVNVTSVSNTTVTIEWFSPRKPNGVVRDYKIFVDNREYAKLGVTSNGNVKNNASVYNFTLEELGSYKNYTITVKACIDSKCSNASHPIVAQTKIGKPSTIKTFKYNSLNNTITWDPPLNKSGKIDFYEIHLVYVETSKTKAVNLTERVYKLEGCDEEKVHTTVKYQIRAVNYYNGTTYEGPWSDEDTQQCQKGGFSILYIVGLSIVIVFLTGCVFVLIFYKWEEVKKTIKTCKNMTRVKYRLNIDTNKSPSAENRGRDTNQHPSSDADHLLDKDSVKMSIDSSGCSSGKESIASTSAASSIDSSTDSGTGEVMTDHGVAFQMQPFTANQMQMQDFKEAVPEDSSDDLDAHLVWGEGDAGAQNADDGQKRKIERPAIVPTAPVAAPAAVTTVIPEPSRLGSMNNIHSYLRVDQLSPTGEVLMNPPIHVVPHQLSHNGYVVRPSLEEEKPSPSHYVTAVPSSNDMNKIRIRDDTALNHFDVKPSSDYIKHYTMQHKV